MVPHCHEFLKLKVNILFFLKQEIQLHLIHNKCNTYITFTQLHCVKIVQIRSFSGPDFPVFRLNTVYGKIRTRINGPEKLRIWTLFTQCYI